MQSRRRGRPGTALVAVAAGLGLLAGCSGAERDSAGDVAERFYEAVGAGDGERVCALLLPAAAEAVADDGAAPCADAVLDPEVTGDLAGRVGGEVEAVHVAGRQAQVVMSDDTVFLARSGDGWVVTAAACDPREDRPYDCGVDA